MFGISKLFTTDIPLDYENVSIYNISIKATDNGNPPSSVTSTITVQVSDWLFFCREPSTGHSKRKSTVFKSQHAEVILICELY